MSAIDVRPLSSVPAEPWRNGGGITRTLATNNAEWRISVAEVERDGPYSRFDGMTRVSFVLRGNGVTLRDGASVARLEPFKAVEYDGGNKWSASLADGPVTALNIMTVTGRYRTTLDALVAATIVLPGCAAIVIALDSGLRYSEPGTSGTGIVAPGEFMVVSSVDRTLRLEPDVPGANPTIIVTIRSATTGTTD